MNAESLAKNIRVLVLDVDGVLTDGGLHYDSEGKISKRFNVQDGLGIKLAQAAGLEIAVISGLDSKAVESRVRELEIEPYYAGRLEKIPLLDEIRAAKGLEYSHLAYMGDDWVDAGPMRVVGLPMTVADAQPEIKDMAVWVSKAQGGHGAVREAINFILKAQGKLDKLWREWDKG
ncbi:MAG: phenylphosphate carboxylase subunit delta [Thermodesulfobacteriota bacterium]|nr:phenylphosphate carboxylase subunit delta [Thermodesulfobacteriota bacterium]